MSKKLLTKKIELMPTPTTLVTVADINGVPDVITVEWISMICFEPMYIGVSIEAASFAHELIESNPEFVVNLVNEDLVHEADLIGKISGRNTDKFEQARLNAQPAKIVKAPLIMESPLNIECKVQEAIKLGTHDFYLGIAVATHVEETVLDMETINIQRLRPVASAGGAYWALGRSLGKPIRMIA